MLACLDDYSVISVNDWVISRCQNPINATER